MRSKALRFSTRTSAGVSLSSSASSLQVQQRLAAEPVLEVDQAPVEAGIAAGLGADGAAHAEERAEHRLAIQHTPADRGVSLPAARAQVHVLNQRVERRLQHVQREHVGQGRRRPRTSSRGVQPPGSSGWRSRKSSSGTDAVADRWRAVMHRDYDAGADLLDRRIEIGQRDRRSGAGEREQHVDAATQRGDLLLCQRSADVPHVTEGDAVELEAVERVDFRIVEAVRALHRRDGLDDEPPRRASPGARSKASTAFSTTGEPPIIAALQCARSSAELISTTSASSHTGSRPASAGV